MSIRPIRFYHRGRIQSVSGVAPTLTLLDWLRGPAHCTGSKEGCNEGDCGACTVLVAELDDGAPTPGCAGAASAVVGGLRLRPLNACLQFLPTLDGKAVLSVEDLGTPQRLHPAQQALVQCHASQCGFCTPGFAVTLAAIHAHHQAAGSRPSRPELADALSGNLCRCTGYRPILDAGEQMFEGGATGSASPAAGFDPAPIVAALRELQAEPALHYAGPDTATPGGAAEQHFHAPRRLGDLAWLLEMHPESRLLAGATDIGLWVNKQFKDLGRIVYLGRVAELTRIDHGHQQGGGTLQIGAAVSLENAWAALTEVWPELREVWRRFASPLIRHAGTLGGNLANGSPIGDGAPVLLALGASLVLQHGDRRRTLPLDAFYLDYMKNALQPGEFIARIDVPLPAPATSHGTREVLRVWKLSKRFDSDISAVCAALQLRLVEGVGSAAGTVRVESSRLAFGGLAATVRRAAQAEQALQGQPWTEASVRAAIAALDADFQPLTDLRASSTYRRRGAANLLWRLWLETRPDAPLAAGQTSVWALEDA